MQTALNDAGTWRPLKGVYANDAGTWRTIKKIYVNDAGTWRTVFSFEIISISVTSTTRSDGGGPAEYDLNADGGIYVREGVAIPTLAGTWTNNPATTGNYEVRATLTSGTLSLGNTGTWDNLGTTRKWTVAAMPAFLLSATLTIEIRRASDSVVVETKSVTITCDRT